MGKDNVAIVEFDEKKGNYKLFIGGVLKAYTTGATDEHKQELEQLVKPKGYIVKYK